MALPITSSLTIRDAARFRGAILKSFTPVERELLEFLYAGGFVDTVVGHPPGASATLPVIFKTSDIEEEFRNGQRVVNGLTQAGWLRFEPARDDKESEVGYFWLTDAAHRFWQAIR